MHLWNELKMCNSHQKGNADNIIVPPTPNELLETFEGLLDWENRYAYVIDLGTELAKMEDSLKRDESKVFGCQSNVWIVPCWRSNNDNIKTFDFVADSDSQIVKGLVAIVRTLYFGKTSQEIFNTNEEDFFEKLGLRKHLTHGRSNGLTQMVKKIKETVKN